MLSRVIVLMGKGHIIQDPISAIFGHLFETKNIEI